MRYEVQRKENHVAKERKQRNKPDVPPEIAEAEAESGLPELPGNIPPYLAFRPSPDSTVAMQQLQMILQNADQKLRTSNHLQAHPMMVEHVLPALLQIADWNIRAQRDLIIYSQHLASWSVERHVVPAVPADLGAALLGHLAKARVGYKTLHELLLKLTGGTIPDADKEAIAVADKLLEELNDEADELEDEVEEEIYDEDDEDDWDDEDDEEPEGEDEEDEEDAEEGEDEDAKPLF